MGLSSLIGLGTKVLGRGSLYVQKYSPEILTVVGIVGVVGSAVLASRATLKLEDTIDESQERLSEVKREYSLVTTEGNLQHSDNEIRKAYSRVYIKNAVSIIKLYGPSVTLGVASIACIVSAHGIMRKRNLALVAAYKSIEQAYTSYRERVIEAYGEEKDREFRHDIRKKEITDAETGKVKKVTGPVDPTLYSPYSRVFDRDNRNWTPNRESNLSFLTLQQNWANHLLSARGHVFLNDIYDSLGMERTKEGAIMGWIAEGEGDNYIDFGIYHPANEELLKSFDREILLDFNVDGIVWDKI